MHYCGRPNSHLSSVIYLLLVSSQTLSFNLDKENVHIIEWEKNSGFGFSTTLWQDKSDKKWIVIGSPTLNRTLTGSTYSGVIGGIVVCDTKKSCKTVQSIPRLESKETLQGLKWAMEKKLPSIGLGETLYTTMTPNPLLVCSPRNINSTEGSVHAEQRPQLLFRGFCYLLETTESSPIILNPFPERTVEWSSKIFQTPSDNAGMGAFFSETGLIVIGLPSMYFYSGGVCSYSLQDNRFLNFSKMVPTSYTNSFYEGWAIVGGKFDGVQETFAVSLPGQPVLMGKVIFYLRTLKQHGRFRLLGEEAGARFGGSLAVADFNGDKVDDLVVSAHLSTVVLNKNILADAGKVYVYYSPTLKTGKAEETSALILNGMAPKSYFGFSMLTPGDLNGDGYDDLVVGAPYEDDSGKVYIFNGSPEGLTIQHSQMISQTDLFRIGFRAQKGIGFSLGGGLDIDSNGYPDIMIGALGSSSAILIRSAPVMTLKMKAGFDDTGIINLGENKCLIEMKDGSLANLTCFNMMIEVHYISQEFKEKISLNFEIHLDTKMSDSRILFKNHQKSIGFNRNIVDEAKPFNLKVYVKPYRSPPTEPIYAKMKVSLPSRRLNPEEKSVTDETNSFASPRIFPMLDSLTNHEVETSVRLVCEDLEICSTKPDLVLDIQGNNHFTVGLKENFRLNISLTIKNDPGFQIRLRGEVPPEFALSRVVRGYGLNSDELWCQKQAEDKNSADVSRKGIICYIADYLQVGKKVQFGLLIDHFPVNITFQMANLKEIGVETSFIFNFTAFSDTNDENEKDNSAIWLTKPIFRSDVLLFSNAVPNSVTIWTNDTDAMRKVKKVLGGRFNSGTLLGSRLKLGVTDYVGANITHKYSFIHAGPSPIMRANILLSWPTHVGGFPLILFWKKIATSGPVMCQPPEDELTMDYYLELPLTMEVHLEGPKALERRKRNAENKTNYETTDIDQIDNLKPNKTIETIKNLDCTTAQCSHIRCDVGSLLFREEVTIEISAVVVAALFNMDKHRQVLLTSEVEFESSFPTMKNTSKIATLVSIKTMELSSVDFIRKQWWILFVSIVGGLLIVLLISLGLYKVGFFKRKRINKEQHKQRGPLDSSGQPMEAVFVQENFMPLVQPSQPIPIERSKERKDYISDTNDSENSE